MRIRLAFCLAAMLTAVVIAGGCFSKRIVKEGGTDLFTVKVNAKSNIFRAGTVDADANGGG